MCILYVIFDIQLICKLSQCHLWLNEFMVHALLPVAYTQTVVHSTYPSVYWTIVHWDIHTTCRVIVYRYWRDSISLCIISGHHSSLKLSLIQVEAEEAVILIPIPSCRNSKHHPPRPSDSLDLDPLPIDYVLVKRLGISWFPQLHFCGRCRNLELTIMMS